MGMDAHRFTSVIAWGDCTIKPNKGDVMKIVRKALFRIKPVKGEAFRIEASMYTLVLSLPYFYVIKVMK